MPIELAKKLIFIVVIFLSGLLVHILCVDAIIVLTVVDQVLGKVLTFCGINGITVTEKPAYMWIVYITYIFTMIVVGFWLVLLMKNMIEKFFLVEDKKVREQAGPSDHLNLISKQHR